MRKYCTLQLYINGQLMHAIDIFKAYDAHLKNRPGMTTTDERYKHALNQLRRIARAQRLPWEIHQVFTPTRVRYKHKANYHERMREAMGLLTYGEN